MAVHKQYEYTNEEWDHNRESYEEFLNRFGSEGWMLSESYYSDTSGNRCVVFMREKLPEGDAGDGR